MPAKFNMRPDKNKMPSQDPKERAKNFKEVALGYTEELALDEANRCLHCPKLKKKITKVLIK